MYYVNSDGKELENPELFFQYFDSGLCAKIYNSSTKYCSRINKDIFDFLKDIDFSCFIKLYDIYTGYNDKEKLFNLNQFLKLKVDAYTANYYEKIDVDPIIYSKDYLLESFYEIEKLFEFLSKNKILTSDIKRANAIFTKDGIVLIDPDLFKFSSDNDNQIIVENKIKLIFLLESLIAFSVVDINEKAKLYRWFYDNYKSSDICADKSVTDHIADTLKYVKRPIDVVRK